MKREIDPSWYAVVDLRSGSEVRAAVAADTETGEVWFLRPGNNGTPSKEIMVLLHGIRIVRRTKREPLSTEVFGG